ncbi:MAG: hypothetical protein KIT79_07965 [Deltaproteobacteria bacterium]|nr:hypothetical protein [Deltaproteobacteria bacterium]
MSWVPLTENDWYYAAGMFAFIQIYMSWMFARQMRKHGDLKPNVSQNDARLPLLRRRLKKNKPAAD